MKSPAKDKVWIIVAEKYIFCIKKYITQSVFKRYIINVTMPGGSLAVEK